jgi:hypothetical protein
MVEGEGCALNEGMGRRLSVVVVIYRWMDGGVRAHIVGTAILALLSLFARANELQFALQYL